METPNDIGSAFTDSVLTQLQKDQMVIDSIIKEPVWDKDRRELLIRLEAKNEETAVELGEAVVALIRMVKGFNFKAEVQTVEVQGKTNFVFKLTVSK